MAALETVLTQLGIPFNASLWYYPSVAEYATLLEKHGLEVREAVLFERPTRLEDAERGLANWITVFCSFWLGRVPEARRGPLYGKPITDNWSNADCELPPGKPDGSCP